MQVREAFKIFLLQLLMNIWGKREQQQQQQENHAFGFLLSGRPSSSKT